MLIPQTLYGRRQMTKEEDVFFANFLGDLNVGTVHGTQEQATVQAELHVGSARGFGSGG
jgi:hypothetical protein